MKITKYIVICLDLYKTKAFDDAQIAKDYMNKLLDEEKQNWLWNKEHSTEKELERMRFSDECYSIGDCLEVQIRMYKAELDEEDDFKTTEQWHYFAIEHGKCIETIDITDHLEY